MSLSLVALPHQTQEPLLMLAGGLSEHLFPRTEALLRTTSKQRALQGIGRWDRAGLYRSMVDYLFCELCGHRREAAAFYADAGPPLRHLPGVTAEKLAAWDTYLAAALHVATVAHHEGLFLSWDDLGAYTEAALAA